MKTSKKCATRLFATLCVLGLSVPGAAAPQDTHLSKDQASLVEEQILLTRKLTRLLGSMERLAERFEAEGRIHAAKLLRDALSHSRSRGEGEERATLEELMDGSRTELDAGQSMQSIETQGRVVADLERLLSILMDRPDLDQLEDSLAELRKLEAVVEGLIDDEQRLQEATDELRERASNDAQRALEEGIEGAIAQQRELLRKNESQARESGSLDLERLERELAELVQDQHTDARVLQQWDPASVPPLEELLPELEAARRKQARAERLQRTAEALRRAAQENAAGEEGGRESRDPVESLQELAEKERRAGRASGDESARRAAEALERAAARLREAGSEADARREAAAEVNELAAEVEREAEAAEREADDSRGAVQEALEELKKEEGSSGSLAREIDEALEDESEIDEALRALAQGIEDLKFLGQALSASQRQNAGRAEQIAEGLRRLPGEVPEPVEGAREDLARAAEAMERAAAEADEEDPQGAQSSAEEAEAALKEAMKALAEARRQGRSPEAGEPPLAAEQEELAEEVEKLEELSQEASLDEESREAVKEELESASSAMRRASEEMSQNKRGSAAREQRSASEALSRAAQKAREGVSPTEPEDLARAEELAREQERIAKELYEFLQRYQEREDAGEQDAGAGAMEAASEAEQALDQGQLSEARDAEDEAEREMEKMLADLQEEEEQYQQLRDEELLFQIAQEVATIREEHLAAAEETMEVDAEREPGSRATRGQKLRLRKIARQEEALADRTTEIGAALIEEGSLVFAELISRIDHDLRLIARDMGETGGYRSGDRVQALQSDVTNALDWLGEALREEKQRREDEQQRQQDQQQQEGGDQQQPPGAPENRLVPDVAELKLLGRMERDVLDHIDELLVVYPELKEATGIDPLLLEEIGRLAHRHERTSELFRVFRERLGLPTPGPELLEEGESPAEGGDGEQDTTEDPDDGE